jgi:hypothetical protein
VPLSAGDITGSRAVRAMESVSGDTLLGAGPRQRQLREQAASLNRAYTEHAFDPTRLTAPAPPQPPGKIPLSGVEPGSTLPRQDVMAKGVQTLGDEYAQIFAGTKATATPKFTQELHDIIPRYQAAALDPVAGVKTLERIRDSLLDKFIGGQWSISGEQYKGLRSRLGDQMQEAFDNKNNAMGNALGEMRSALDNTMRANLTPAQNAALRANDIRYGNMKQLTQAVAKGGENLTPASVQSSVRAGRSGAYAQGKGDLDELTNAAATVLRPLPNSNTAMRTTYQNPLSLPNLTTAMGLVPRLVISKPVQAWLGNQVAPQSVRDILTQAMVQQGISQPSVLARNEAEQSADEQKRQQDLVDRGLAQPLRIKVNPATGGYR